MSVTTEERHIAPIGRKTGNRHIEKIVHYNEGMLDEMLRLFYNTVHTVNARDYDHAQLDNWAPVAIDKSKWKERLSNNVCLVSFRNEQIVGFGELSEEGGIDTMFVHQHFQGKKIASGILKQLINYAHHHELTTLTTDASITARPFFERHGFEVVKKRRNQYKGMVFINYKMKKNITQ